MKGGARGRETRVSLARAPYIFHAPATQASRKPILDKVAFLQRRQSPGSYLEQMSLSSIGDGVTSAPF